LSDGPLKSSQGHLSQHRNNASLPLLRQHLPQRRRHSLIAGSKPTPQGAERCKSNSGIFYEISNAASVGSRISDASTTRYDELAINFFSALCFVAMLAYWL